MYIVEGTAQSLASWLNEQLDKGLRLVSVTFREGYGYMGVFELIEHPHEGGIDDDCACYREGYEDGLNADRSHGG